MSGSNYDKEPFIQVAGGEGRCVTGWEQVCETLKQAVGVRGMRRCVMTVECYTGVFEEEIAGSLQALGPVRLVRSAQAFLPPAEIERKVAPFDGGDDPIFGRMNGLVMGDLMDPERVQQLASEIAGIDEGLVIMLGCGATLIHPGDILVYADLARWEAQLHMRRDEISNLGVENRSLKWSLNVLNLVEGREVVVESPTGAFEPFVVHYAETFIVPAAVGAYTIRPNGESEGKECATLKAFVRN